MKKKIVFMGTPDIACAMLSTLVQDGYDVVGVVSQPDKKVGRKQEIQMSDVKKLALSFNLPVFQPLRISEDYQMILDWQPDVIVTCAYGQFIPEVVLQAPTFGSVNVHASLLPKLRGGAPIHWAIINGDEESGISIMRMVKKMDAGEVMAQSHVRIEQEDTMGTLYEKLKVSGAKLLSESLPILFAGNAQFIQQDEAKATLGYNIQKEEEKIDFTKDIQEIYNHIRGLIPWPVGYAYIEQKKVKFHKVRMKKENHENPIGELIGIMDDGYAIAVSGGYIIIDELQLEGKGKVDAKAFYNGNGKQWIGKIIK